MFDKFGEMDSCEEINELAENLFNEGDTESLKLMAKENGIPEEMTDLYLSGEMPELCDALTAALGKIEIESADLKPKEIMEDWVEYLKGQCMEDEHFAAQVRKKGKSLKGCIASLLKWSFGHQQEIDHDIVKAANMTNVRRVTLGIPGMGQAKQLIREYYGGAA
ncbi:MAG: PcfK-like family protein [Lachnospiraceae bacterium]|nr:PcfK-like family protein [Lachnospiraceae bacterium]